MFASISGFQSEAVIIELIGSALDEKCTIDWGSPNSPSFQLFVRTKFEAQSKMVSIHHRGLIRKLSIHFPYKVSFEELAINQHCIITFMRSFLQCDVKTEGQKLSKPRMKLFVSFIATFRKSSQWRAMPRVFSAAFSKS